MQMQKKRIFFFIWIINTECKHRTCALCHFIICKFVLTSKSGFTAGTIDIGAKLNIFVNTAYNKNDKNWFYQIIKWSIYHFYCYELVCNEYNAIPLWIDSFPHIMKKTLDFCRISSGSCSITYPQSPEPISDSHKNMLDQYFHRKLHAFNWIKFRIIAS